MDLDKQQKHPSHSDSNRIVKHEIDKNVFQEFFSVFNNTNNDLRKSFSITPEDIPKNLSKEQFKELSSNIQRIKKTNLFFTSISTGILLFTFAFINYLAFSDSQKVQDFLIEQSYQKEIKLENPYEKTLPAPKLNVPSREDILKIFPDFDINQATVFEFPEPFQSEHQSIPAGLTITGSYH